VTEEKKVKKGINRFEYESHIETPYSFMANLTYTDKLRKKQLNIQPSDDNPEFQRLFFEMDMTSDNTFHFMYAPYDLNNASAPGDSI